MNLERFEQLVANAVDNLDPDIREKLNNVAILVEDEPTTEQRKKVGLDKRYDLFGLFEGYAQASRLNFGAVLPDRITIFRRPICRHFKSEEQIKEQIFKTLKHEIAHHFGSNEDGARKAAGNK